jgi:hypothetical protein
MNIQLPKILLNKELITEYQALYDHLKSEKASVDVAGGQGVGRYVWEKKYKNAESVVETFRIIDEMNRETNPNRYLDWAYRAFSLLANDYDKDGSTSFKGKTALFEKRVQELKAKLSKRKIDGLVHSLLQRLQTWATHHQTGQPRLKISFEPAHFSNVKAASNSVAKARGLLHCLVRADSDSSAYSPAERSETPLSSSTDRSTPSGNLSEGF